MCPKIILVFPAVTSVNSSIFRHLLSFFGDVWRFDTNPANASGLQSVWWKCSTVIILSQQSLYFTFTQHLHCVSIMCLFILFIDRHEISVICWNKHHLKFQNFYYRFCAVITVIIFLLTSEMQRNQQHTFPLWFHWISKSQSLWSAGQLLQLLRLYEAFRFDSVLYFLSSQTFWL